MSTSGRGVDLRSLAFGGILVLALGLRLADLGSVPLSDAEAREALGAAAGTDDASAFWSESEHPAGSGVYQAVTWLLFQSAGSGEAAARAFPAVLGALIVVPPWLLRRRLGDGAALFAAFLLAISPMLVAISRTAGGASASIVGLAFSVAALILALDDDLPTRKAVVFGGAGLAVGLAGGSLFFHGLLTVTLAGVLKRWIGLRTWPAGRVGEAGKSLLPGSLAIGFIGAAVLSTAVGLLPRGGAALGEGVRQWLVGWLGPGGMNPASPPVILLAYEPLGLFFGILGLVAAWRGRDALGAGLGLWVAAGLVVAIVYPARSGEVVAWIVLPLAILAGRALAAEADAFLSQPLPWVSAGVGALLLVLLLYAGLQLAAYAGGIGPGSTPLDPTLRLAVAIGAVVVSGLATVLIGFGWSFAIARSGAAVASAGALLLMTVSASSWLNFQREHLGARELWAPSAPTYGVSRLTSTLHSLAATSTGVRDELPVAIVGDDTPPSIIWAARDFERFLTSDSALPENPPLILRPALGPAPEFAAEYVGQTIPISESWDFAGPLPPQPLTWWFRRILPTVDTTWILLARSDLATLGEAGLATSDEP